jgi:lipopolysaccharide transport system ATP-binding protein
MGMTRAEVARKFDEIVDFSGVEQFIDTPVKRYSSGMYVRLAFAVAAHLEPDILIVDEVLAVGDMAFQQKCLGCMGDVARGGRTVIFVSHNMAAISQLTQRCLVIDRGMVKYDGPTPEAIGCYMQERAGSMGPGWRPVSELDCKAQWINDPAASILEVGLASGQSDTIPIDGSLSLEILIEMRERRGALRFGYSINDELQSAIMTGFSPEFTLEHPGRHLCRLTLDHLPLCPGTFSMSISLGTGGLHEPKHVIHAIIGFGRFCVSSALADGRPVGDWSRSWGHLVHSTSQVNTAPCEYLRPGDAR